MHHRAAGYRMGRGVRMARLSGALRRLRTRIANCSLRAAFALYATVAILAAIVLSFVSTWVLGYIANTTLPDDLWAYTGTYVYDANNNQLVPADALSWYEMSAYDAAIDLDVAGTDTIVLYVASKANADNKVISLDDPPVAVDTLVLQDMAWLMDGTSEATVDLKTLASYDAAASAARPGADAAATLAAELPANTLGERPVVSNVGYYLPYPDDPFPYRALAVTAIASVPIIFVACLVIAGRRFYRTRLARPIAAMDEAARRIAANDLDFTMAQTRNDELGRLCAQFETMRAELARTEAELWRAAENRRQVNAAFAHDLRTPLTVVSGQAQLIERMAQQEAVRHAAAAIARQAERLTAFAESMRDLDTLDATAVEPAPLDLNTWLDEAAADARAVVQAAGATLTVARTNLPPLVAVDVRALSRIVDNLVANAARYARATVHLALLWENNQLELAVSDDGSGFDDAALRRAAEPFWSASKGSGGHLGLGLYITRSLAEKHGGALAIANGPEGGALLRVQLAAPLVPGGNEPTLPTGPAAATSASENA